MSSESPLIIVIFSFSDVFSSIKTDSFLERAYMYFMAAMVCF
jgi:hypothetical protein